MRLVTRSTRHKWAQNKAKQSIIVTRALQPVATCRRSPYLHKPAIIIMMSSHYDVASLAPTALAAPVLIMTSFSLWRHSLLSWPRPALRTYVAGTLPRLVYKDVYLLTFQRLIYLSFYQLPIVIAQILLSASGASVLGKKYCQLVKGVFLCDELTVWRVDWLPVNSSQVRQTVRSTRHTIFRCDELTMWRVDWFPRIPVWLDCSSCSLSQPFAVFLQILR